MNDNLMMCRFCRSYTPQIHDFEDTVFFVCCTCCGARGPKAESKEAAAITWNRAWGKKAREREGIK